MNCDYIVSPPMQLLSAFGFFIQIVPKRDRKLHKKAAVVVSGKNVWKVSMPKFLGGHRGFQRVLTQLEKYDPLVPDFWINDIQRHEAHRHLWYTRESNVYHLLLTRDWGWDKRDHSEDNWTEFYGLYRRLAFKCAQASLREHCICKLNHLFKRLGLNVSLSVEGFLSAEELQKTQTKLLRGEVTFTEVFNRCINTTLTTSTQ